MEIINVNKSKSKIANNYETVYDISFKGSFDQAAKTLNYHHEGLRELIKNSGSAMLRNFKDEKDRNCILLFRDQGGKEKKSLIGFLDFVGMTRERIKRLQKLNSSTAGLGKDITDKDELWAGHGNGGKIYGAKFFDKASWITCFNNKLNQGEFETNIVSKNKYFSDLKDEDVGFRVYNEKPLGNPEQKLRAELKRFKINYNLLNDDIKEALQNKNFTLFIGENPQDNKRSIKKKNLLEHLLKDSEAYEPLKFVKLQVFHNGKIIKDKVNNSFRHEPEILSPHQEFEKPRRYEIPDKLIDPSTGKELDFTNTDEKYMIIKSWSKDFLKARNKRHVIRGRISRGIKATVGKIKISDVTPHTLGFPKHLYGDIFHDELSKFASNTRADFNEDPKISALKNWISGIFEKIHEEFDKKNEDKISKKSQQNIEQFHDKLQEILKEKDFLQNPFGMESGSGKNTKKKDGEEDNEEDEYKKKYDVVDRVELSLHSNFSGIGVTFRPNVKCFNKYDYEIKNPRLEFIISDYKIVSPHERKLNLLYTIKEGSVEISVKELKSNKISNKQKLVVIKLSSIKVESNKITLKERSKTKIPIKCYDQYNKLVKNPYLTYISNDIEIAEAASTGLIFGRTIGNTEITAMTHDCESSIMKVEVLHNEEKKKNKGGFPKICYSGIHSDPLVDGEEIVMLSPDAPPVYQRVWDLEHGIWWVNLQSPIANKIFKTKNRGIAIQDGEKSKQFRMYIVLQIFEILSRINVLNSKEDPPETMEEFKRLTDNEITKFHKILEPYIDYLMSSDIFNINEKK